MLVVLLIAIGVGGWALNRFVIDHVEIGDVRVYESEINAGTTEPPLQTFPLQTFPLTASDAAPLSPASTIP